MISLALLTASSAFLVWFLARARLGARARATGNAQAATRDRLVAIVARLSLDKGLLGGLAGTAFAGLGFGVAGAIAGCAWKPVQAVRASRARGRALATQMPEVLRALAGGLRAGRSLPQALAAARDDAAEPVRAALGAAVERLSLGAPMEDALEAFARAASCEAARTAAETLRIGRAAGANLPQVIDVMVESLTERDRLARDRRAATSQARMSAAVVASMPLAFFVLLGKNAKAQIAVLVGTPAGWVLLGLGLSLEAAGVWWMRSMVRA